MREVTGIGGVLNGSGVRAQVARPGSPHGGSVGRVGEGRRRASGPRPVRPVPALTLVRPAQVPRPVCAVVPVEVARPRLLVRGAAAGPVVAAERVRRMLAGLAAVVVTAAVVVGLGLLAAAAGAERAVEPGPAVARMTDPAVVTVERAGSVWDVARVIAPAADGPATAALVERIVTLNHLGSVAVAPGQVLRVPAG